MFRYLLQKEWIQIRRNTFVVRLIILFPIVIMGIAPWITSMEVRNIGVSIVDHDQSSISRQLIQRVEASTYFNFCGTAPSYNRALQALERGKTDIIIVVPHHYAHDLTLGKPTRVLIAANAVNGTKGGIVCIGSGCYDWYSIDPVTPHYHQNVATLTRNAINLLKR